LSESLVALGSVQNDVAGVALAFRRIDERDVPCAALSHAVERRRFLTFVSGGGIRRDGAEGVISPQVKVLGRVPAMAEDVEIAITVHVANRLAIALESAVDLRSPKRNILGEGES
jgi:hypothetical protein